MKQADVVIIGGGMAGLSTAVTLCENSDLHVLLVERNDIGYNKTTPAVYLETVEEYGLEKSILQLYDGFVYHSPLGGYSDFNFNNFRLACLDYKMACGILMDRIQKRNFLHIHATAKDWTRKTQITNRSLTLRLKDADSIDTEIIVDASGHEQWAAGLLGIKRSSYYSHCYGEYMSGCSMEKRSYFRFLGPTKNFGSGGGWFYPAGKGAVSFGYSAMIPSAKNDATKMKESYLKAKREFAPYAQWVSNGVVERVERGIIPVGRVGRFVSDRVLIVGDAAGQANPWVAEGCRPALNNGKKCAQVILKAFSKKRFDRGFLSLYESEWNKINRERFWRTASVASIVWNKSDSEWNELIDQSKNISPEKFISWMKENRDPLSMRIYAVLGHARRSMVKWLREFIKQVSLRWEKK